MKPHTPLPWHTRGPARHLRLFIEAPKANGMPYALDVCGDDYTGYGEDAGREQNMRYIVHACNNYPETAAERDRLREVNAELLAALEEFAKATEAFSIVPVRLMGPLTKARAAIAKAKGAA